ncbi:MAG: DUF11 domain-containing protein [Planctomycetia bacterium]|nr:DUF11 domain-containing protein [Planctomycetia bacterium]
MSVPSAQPRPSRQDLVVSPRHSPLSAVIGGIVCAAVGFGLVWALGIGRSPRPDDIGPETPAVAAEDASPPQPLLDARAESANDAAPDLLPPIDNALPATPPTRNDRWQPRAASRDRDADDRYPTKPASLDLPDQVVPAAGESATPTNRFSRYSSADLVPPADAVPEVTTTEAIPPADEGAPPSAATTEASDATGDAAASAPADFSPPAAFGVPSAAELPAAEPMPEDPGDRAVAAPQPPPAAAAFGAAPPDFPAAPNAPAPLPPLPAVPSQRSAPPAFGAAATSGIAATPAAPLPLAATPPVGVGSPFAAAPPLVGGLADADPEVIPSAPPPAHAQPGPTTGQGRPGPMQLEGVQTPQISVEKRGPREISVGKPARYEILVRNIGSATAHEVMLRDAVPQGTSLVTTTPPASPINQASGDAEGALAWLLGTMPPGGQAIVTMEVMPQVEGEIGSIASVSFRADASVRSRATKPDLRIECAEPAPVLIGRDLQITITVTNPGTGTATGVVLEGFLPENVSHRSGRELEFDVGQLRPGESRTLDLVLGTRGPGVHAARFSARADGGVEVVHQVPIEVTAPTLELAVDMPLRRFLQRPATCTISMVNAGTAPARAVELAAQLPPGMKFVKANNAGWHDDRTHRVLWNLEELPAGETGSVQMVVMPVELGPQKIVAAARSADGLADQVAHTCDVEGLAALSFEVVDSEDPIEVDGVTEYVVRVGNLGTKPATGVRLVATLLGDLEPLDAQGPGGHRFENLTVTFEPLAKLAPAEEAVFRIRAKGRRAGDQRVQVQLTSADQPAPITKEEITRVYADR